ncbi:MAG: SlyX family protein, partial [Pseudomonas sp.]|nr:SlyX family protein [Pseudomonas sp.]
LNDVLVDQQRLLDRLQLQLAALARRQDEQQNQFGSEDNQPPPHY